MSADTGTMALADGTVLGMSPLVPSDRAAVDALHRRCTPATLERRYFMPLVRLSGAMFRRLADPAYGRSVAVRDGEHIVALAHLMVTPEDRDVGDISVLIEDAWQGRGLGSALTRIVVEQAAALGFAGLHADMRADNERMRAIMRSLDGADGRAGDAELSLNWWTW
ncbi:GNAT family N-acetyltransferase [Streptomyces atratus]|uniref:GNAT family N-acetyltransferase n=1 Tax=Streptomyces atratus TaxID=1893 RepID=UPI0033C15C33